MMLPVSESESLCAERICLILRTIFDSLEFLFCWIKQDLIIRNKQYIKTKQITIIELDYTIFKIMKKILTLFPYGRSCAL